MPADAAGVLADAESLHTQARAAINRYRAAEAKGLVERVRATLARLPRSATAAEVATAQTLLLRTQLTECWVIFEESGPGPAISNLEDVLAEAQTLHNDEVAAAALLQKAVLLGRSGNQAAGLAAARAALEFRAAMSPNDEAIVLLTLGNLTGAEGDFDAARAAMDEAADVATAAGLPELAFMARHNGGHLEYLRGDLPQALTLMEQADEMDVAVDRSIARLDRGRTLLDAGLLDDARDVLHSAATLAAASSAWHDLAEIELVTARCELLRGRLQDAVALARQAKRRFQQRGEHGWRYRALMVELEAVSLLGTSTRSRSRVAGAVYAASRALGDTMAAIRAALLWSEALVESGELDLVEPVLAEAERHQNAPQISTRLHLAYVTAGYLTARGRPDRAQQHLTDAARELLVARQTSASIDLRTALSVHGTRLTQLDWRLAIESGRPELVLARVELWRGAARGQAPVRPASDEREAGLLTRLRNVREEMRAATGADLDALQTEASDLYGRIRSMSWKVAAAREPITMHEEFPLEHVASALGRTDATLLVLLAVDRHTFYVIMWPSGALELVPGPDPTAVAKCLARVQADVIAQTRVPSGPLTAAVGRSLAKGLAQLDDLLLGPAKVADSPLVIAPPLDLGLVPWGMLPSRRGAPTTVTRTATSWVRGAVTRSAPVVTAIAGPDLPHAASEVGRVAEVWHGAAVGPDTATSDDLLTALTTSDLVHVAAHGEHQSESPLFSSVRLSDGSVFAHEFESRQLQASHVVLSACHAGRTTPRPGGESIGLASTLLELGVTAVVAPVTAVPDELAGEVMTEFHQHLAAGVEAAAALATATADQPPLAASFTMFGAPWSIASESEPASAEKSDRARITVGGGFS